MNTHGNTAENLPKMRELVIYILSKCNDDETLGRTKLNKILFYCDFMAYLNFRESITGYAYKALDKGPVPTAFFPEQQAMVKRGEIQDQLTLYHGNRQHRLSTRNQPDLELFSDNELSLINHVIDANRENNANDISTLSHKFIGWKLAYPTNGIILYETSLVDIQNKELSKEVIEYGLSLEPLARKILSENEYK